MTPSITWHPFFFLFFLGGNEASEDPFFVTVMKDAYEYLEKRTVQK
jgi:hypothetical protein